MAGESDDLAARNLRILQEALAGALGKEKTFPTPPAANPGVLSRPLSLDDETRRAPPKDRKMSSNGDGTTGGYVNAQIPKLIGDVENLKTNYHDLKLDIDSRFSALSGEIRSMRSEVVASFESMRSRGGLDLGKLAAVGTVLLVIIGGFASLAKTNLDTNIAFTNEKIGTQASITRDEFTATNANILAVTAAVQKVVDTTIPRPELEYRINGNRDAITTALKTQDTHSTQIATALTDAANLKADVERLKGDIVTRRENEGHWEDLSNRVNLLSNRLNDLVKSSGGLSSGEQIKAVQDQLNMLQQKFIGVVPAGDGTRSH